jgi:two-component system response regulator VanR
MFKYDLKLLKHFKFLYVEDDPMLQDAVVMILSYFCKNIVVANNGVEGVQRYREERPNIIITDIRMPKMNGLEMITQIRKEDTKTPIIVLSAHKEEEMLLQAIRLDLVDYLIKPFEFNDFQEALKRSIEKLHDREMLDIKLEHNIHYNMLLHQFQIDNQAVNLTKIETVLLELLLINIGRVVTYKEIVFTLQEQHSDYKEPSIDNIKNSIMRLRKKVGKELIKNHKDMGYQISDYRT